MITSPQLAIAGALVGLAGAVLLARRHRTIDAVGMGLTLLVALAVTRRLEWPLPHDSPPLLVAGAAVVLALSGRSMTRTLGAPWVLAGSVVSLVGMWVGVPETGQVLVTGGVLAVLTLAAFRMGATTGALAVVTLAFCWCAVVGAVGRSWALEGGLWTAGVAVGWLASRVARRAVRIRAGIPAGPWLLLPHAALAVAAGRWVAVDPVAGATRLIVLSAASFCCAAAVRDRAEADEHSGAGTAG